MQVQTLDGTGVSAAAAISRDGKRIATGGEGGPLSFGTPAEIGLPRRPTTIRRSRRLRSRRMGERSLPATNSAAAGSGMHRMSSKTRR